MTQQDCRKAQQQRGVVSQCHFNNASIADGALGLLRVIFHSLHFQSTTHGADDLPETITAATKTWCIGSAGTRCVPHSVNNLVIGSTIHRWVPCKHDTPTNSIYNMVAILTPSRSRGVTTTREQNQCFPPYFAPHGCLASECFAGHVDCSRRGNAQKNSHFHPPHAALYAGVT